MRRLVTIIGIIAIGVLALIAMIREPESGFEGSDVSARYEDELRRLSDYYGLHR